MMKFSDRMGITPRKVIQIEGMNMALRNGLWNKLLEIEDLDVYLDDYDFLAKFWDDFLVAEKTVDSIPHKGYGAISEWYKKAKWNEVYDFLEFFVSFFKDDESIYIAKGVKPKTSPKKPPIFIDDDSEISELKSNFNIVLTRENSAYRFVGDKLAPIINSTEIAEIEDALQMSANYTAFKGANIHLTKSLEKLSDKKNPDYRNSVKESISAIESIAKIISGKPNATLRPALDKLNKKIKIHGALAQGFKNLYGWTSDENGIRHCLMEEKANCDFDDAKFMLVSCSAFINYLIGKSIKAGIDLN